MRAGIMGGAVLLVCSGCATGQYSDESIASRYQSAVSYCVEHRPTYADCYAMAREARDQTRGDRYSFTRIMSAVFGSGNPGGGRPVQDIFIVNQQGRRP